MDRPTFTESDRVKLQVLSIGVIDWFRSREIRLVHWEGMIDGQISLTSGKVGILFPGKKSNHPAFVGVLHFDPSKKWAFYLYGRENLDQVTKLMADLSQDLGAEIKITLEDEFTRSTSVFGGCANIIAVVLILLVCVSVALISVIG